MISQAQNFSAGRQIAAFTLGLSGAAAILGLWLRWNTGELAPLAPIMALLTASAALLLPIVIIERSNMGSETGALFYGPLVAVTTLAIALLGRASHFGSILVTAGALIAFTDLASRRRRDNVVTTVAISALGIFVGLLVAFNIQANGYLRVFTEDLMLTGKAVNPDTFMHLAFAQMIRHQHVISTGVEGVTPVTMYALSHALIGWLTELLGGETVRIADEVFSIILIPLMLGSVLSGAISLTGGRGRLLASAAVVGAAVLAYPQRAYFKSETYCVALFIFMSMMVPAASSMALGTVHAKWSRISLVLIGLAGISLATFGKASVGILSAGLFGLSAWIAAWRRPTLFERVLWMALAALAVGLVFVPSFLAVVGDLFWSVVGAEGEPPFYPDLSWATLGKALVTNLPAILAAFLLLVRPKWIGSPWRSKTLLFILIVFMVAANAPGISQAVSLGQYYIVNVQMWLGLTILAALASMAIASERPKVLFLAEAGLVTVAAMVVFVLSAPPMARLLKIIDRAERQAISAHKNPTIAARRNVLQDIIAHRVRLGARLRVYVPPTHTEFWTLIKHCEARTMLIPAATGVPVIDGFPPLWTGCASAIRHRGWQVISPRSSDEVLNDARLCEVDKTTPSPPVIYVLTNFSDSGLNRLVDCAL